MQKQYGDFSTETQLQRIFLEWAGKHWENEPGSRYWTNCDSIRTFTLVPTKTPNRMFELNEEVRNYFAKKNELIFFREKKKKKKIKYVRCPKTEALADMVTFTLRTTNAKFFGAMGAWFSMLQSKAAEAVMARWFAAFAVGRRTLGAQAAAMRGARAF